MDIRERIGWNRRRLRRERGLTQEEFATDSGFDRAYISGIERGVRNPSALVLERVANALKVDTADLVDKDAAENLAEKSAQV